MTPKQIRDAIKKENSHYQQAINELDKKLCERDEAIKNIQRQCKHKNTTYVSDPSGNADSYYECDDCGKEL